VWEGESPLVGRGAAAANADDGATYGSRGSRGRRNDAPNGRGRGSIGGRGLAGGDGAAHAAPMPATMAAMGERSATQRAADAAHVQASRPPGLDPVAAAAVATAAAAKAAEKLQTMMPLTANCTPTPKVSSPDVLATTAKPHPSLPLRLMSPPTAPACPHSPPASTTMGSTNNLYSYGSNLDLKVRGSKHLASPQHGPLDHDAFDDATGTPQLLQGSRIAVQDGCKGAELRHNNVAVRMFFAP
jgi:hypothetical protein